MNVTISRTLLAATSLSLFASACGAGEAARTEPAVAPPPIADAGAEAAADAGAAAVVDAGSAAAAEAIFDYAVCSSGGDPVARTTCILFRKGCAGGLFFGDPASPSACTIALPADRCKLLEDRVTSDATALRDHAPPPPQRIKPGDFIGKIRAPGAGAEADVAHGGKAILDLLRELTSSCR